jgi:hypothetical protein
VAEIAAASDSQSEGVDQVNRAIAQIDGVTQQNAALVEENAAASKLVSAQSEQLWKDISFFRIAGGQAASVTQFAVAGGASRQADAGRREEELYRLAS